MTEQTPRNLETLSPALEQLVDRQCDRFEAAWRAGRPPLLEHYLDQAPVEARPLLLWELLQLELTYRREHNEQPREEEYIRRFPEQADVVRAAFAEPPGRLPQATSQLLVKWKLSWLLSQAFTPEDLAEKNAAMSGQGNSEVPTQPLLAQAAVPVSPSALAQAVRSEGSLLGKLEAEYVFLGRLGRGGMGVVYKALERKTNRVVALKIIRPDLLEGGTPEERCRWIASFRRGAELTGQLEHDHIVPLYHVGEDQGQFYYVMRYIEGRSLGEIVREEGPLPRERAARCLEQVARAVQYAHSQHVLHVDLKPRNILIDAKEDRAYLTDFGLARLLGITPESHSTIGPVGTYPYMAPEQARERPQFHVAGDIYGLGATLYDLVTGRPPFQSGDAAETLRQLREDEPLPPRRLNPAVDRDLETIILTCLHKEPARRYGSAAALADDLANYLAGRPIQARPVGRLERCWRWCRRNPWQALRYFAAALALLAVTALSAFGVQMHNVAEARQASLDATAWRVQALMYEHGQEHCLRGDVALGLLWKVRSLEYPSKRNEDLENYARQDVAAWGRNLPALKAFLPHEGDILTAAFNPDGKLLATGSADGRVRVWDVATGQLHFPTPFVQDEPARVLALSPDGKTLAVVGYRRTAASDRIVNLWDLATGKQLCSLRSEGESRFVAAAFHPDGQTVFTAGNDGSLQRWRVATGERLGCSPARGNVALPAFGGSVVGLGATSPGIGPIPITAALLNSRNGDVKVVAFSANGKTALLGWRDGTAQLWNLATMKPIGGSPLTHEDPLTSAAFAPDSNTVLTGSGDSFYRRGEVRRWDVATAKRLPLVPLPLRGSVLSLVPSPDGASVFTASKDDFDPGELQFWDISSGRRLSRLPLRPGEKLLAVSSDCAHFLIGGKEGWGQLWETTAGPRSRQVARAEADIRALAIDSTGATILTAGRRKANVWSNAGGLPLSLNHQKAVFAAALSPGGELVATGGGDGIRLWHTLTGAPLDLLRQQRGWVNAVTFSPDGKTLVEGGDQGFWVWALATGELLQHLWPNAKVWALAFSPDGKYLLTGSWEGEAQLWDTTTWIPVGEPLRHQHVVWSVAFSPDGKYLLTGSGDTTAQFWETATGKPHGPPLLHEGSVRTVAFSHDGRLASTGSSDRTARLWDVATAKSVGPPLLHPFSVEAVVFTPDGKALLTAGDQVIRAWDLAPSWGESVEQLRRRIEFLTGQELDTRGAVHPLGADAWQQRPRSLSALGGTATP